MKQITIQILDHQQVEQVVDILSDFDCISSIDVDTVWQPDEIDEYSVIKIIESNSGPLISQSRASVYDVMEANDEGYNPSDIGNIYNLSPHQVDVALAYISQHRSKLEPELKRIQTQMAEREAYHRAIVAEQESQWIREMTPERAKFNALLERSRRSRGES